MTQHRDLASIAIKRVESIAIAPSEAFSAPTYKSIDIARSDPNPAATSDSNTATRCAQANSFAIITPKSTATS